MTVASGMAQVTLADVKNVLQQYQARFRWLDVFVADVELPNDTALLAATNADNGEYQVSTLR